MTKWKKPSDSKAMKEKKIYSQIKQAEKISSPITLNQDQEGLRYHFAHYCHKHRYEKAPSGALWPNVFLKKWGMSLSEYGELLRQRQKEKHEARNTQVDDSLP